MKIAIAKETAPGESRVALIPASLPKMQKLGFEVSIETGAGLKAGFPDDAYQEKGATIVGSRNEVFEADIVLQVRSAGANPSGATADIALMRQDQIIIGSCDPLGAAGTISDVAPTGAILFSLEMIPRITRAQSMDVLSSQATIAGYRAVLLAAVELPKMFPMMMTAAGTLSPAKAFVIGAGVAGLQAIATARRLGAVVQGYDVRPAVREQVESLGAKFVEMELDTAAAEDKGGYAKELGEDFYRKQRELMAEVVSESDLVISTAAIPGKKSPLLITADAVKGMAPGSVIVDLAAERGGNCELSQPNERVEKEGVVILGPTNLPSEIPNHASQMLSQNALNYLQNMLTDGKPDLDGDDEIVRETMMTRGGEVVNNRVRDILGLEPLNPPEPEPETESSAEGGEEGASEEK